MANMLTTIEPGETTPAPPMGNGRFFVNQTYHFETLRGLGYTVSGGADIGEVLETVRTIQEGDPQSWFAAWTATSERVHALAERTKDRLSKGGAYLRAHGYQRTAGFLLPPDDPMRPESWRKEVAYFDEALGTLGIPYERFRVPFDGGSLRALYVPGGEGADRKPLIVFVGGYDSSLEELYLVLGKAAADRGYSILLYEGPGQGQALRDGMTFVPDWERPTGAVLDEFLRNHPRPRKLVLMGMSMGGYFASRAAAFDDRFDGLITFDVCFDCEETTRGVANALEANPDAIRNPDVAWAFRNAVWTMGIKSPTETRAAFAPYTLRNVADRIRQDVLILEGTEDHFIPAHQLGDFQEALVNARSVTTHLFDRASGGAAHCQEGALTLLHATIFDWLITKFE